MPGPQKFDLKGDLVDITIRTDLPLRATHSPLLLLIPAIYRMFEVEPALTEIRCKRVPGSSTGAYSFTMLQGPNGPVWDSTLRYDPVEHRTWLTLDVAQEWALDAITQYRFIRAGVVELMTGFGLIDCTMKRV